eukprot:snap_masked-scaffold_22-processed-gene-2.36-mRNA-1 protein AED:1.00 eAED:1.00 QI:0/-1/0/0/-1/1/1/0/60
MYGLRLQKNEFTYYPYEIDVLFLTAINPTKIVSQGDTNGVNIVVGKPRVTLIAPNQSCFN